MAKRPVPPNDVTSQEKRQRTQPGSDQDPKKGRWLLWVASNRRFYLDNRGTPREFVRPASPHNQLREAERPIYTPSALICWKREVPYHWVRYRVWNKPPGKVKMTVDALVGDFAQSTTGLADGMPRACSLLALRIGEWMLGHSPARPVSPTAQPVWYPVPSSDNLDRIIFQVEREVKSHRLFRAGDRLADISAIQLQFVPSIKILCTIQMHFASGGDPLGTEDASGLFIGGSFDVIWDKYIATWRDEVFVAHYKNHFFVLRIDDRGKFFVVDTLGCGVNRASVLAFGTSTFLTLREGSLQPSDSAEACKNFFKFFIGNHEYWSNKGYGNAENDEKLITLRPIRFADSSKPDPPLIPDSLRNFMTHT
ncbi:hypothetical protein L7F22_046553 [Adiantum nelumboides]|nr:hypothetical protein [Adiantum nelumboides]